MDESHQLPETIDEMDFTFTAACYTWRNQAS